MNSGKIIPFKKGVLFDKNLNFNTTFHRCLKSYFMHSTVLSLFCKKIFSEKYLKALYYSLFHCRLTYALEIWSSTTPSLLQQLINKQKAAIRISHTKSAMIILNLCLKHSYFYLLMT
jgi:hypothetical protein